MTDIASHSAGNRRETFGGLANDWMGFLRVTAGDYVRKVQLKRDVARQRRQLGELSDRELRDIGLSRSEALSEAARGIDDLPVGQMKKRLR